MSEEENKYEVEIPQLLHSEATNVPFTHCNICDGNLDELDSPYMVEKAFKNYSAAKHQDVIFEYAICESCYLEMSAKMSVDSRKKMQAFMASHIHMEERHIAYKNGELSLTEMMDTCLVTGERNTNCEEYQVIAQCRKDKLQLDFLPMMISGKIMEQIQELFSPETKEEMDDFMRNITSPSPDFAELFTPPKVFVV